MAKAKTPKTPPGFSEEAPTPPAPPPRKPMAQRAYEEAHPPRRAVNLTASSYWLHEAKTLGLNLSEIFGVALEAEVRAQRREELTREMAEFAEWYNKDIEEHGLWSDGLRMF